MSRKSYFTGEHQDVSGWVAPGALSFLLALNQFQHELQIGGSVCEIGVHHGRYFIALANLLENCEFAVGYDIFGMQEKNVDKSGCGDFEIAQQNILKHFSSTTSTAKLVVADSLKLTSREILDQCTQQVRLFSVDGGHTEYHAVNDLCLAQEVIADGGVIIVDDFYNPDWPGVAEGMNRFFILNHLKKIAPFAYGDNKLYLCDHLSRDKYFVYFANLKMPGIYRKAVRLWGYEALHIRMPSPEKIDDAYFSV